MRKLKICTITFLILFAIAQTAYMQVTTASISGNVSEAGNKGKVNTGSPASSTTPISGLVTEQGGEPLPGVSVMVKGTTVSTVTGIDGKYSVPAFLDNSVLVFVFNGYQTVEIPVRKAVVDVELKKNSSSSETNSLAGATIVATHLPTGTKTGTVSDAKGNFRLNNLRPGGPYSVTISFLGYKTQEYQNIMLALADEYVLNVQLQDDSQNLGDVVVIGNHTVSNMNSSRAGAITSITSREMDAMPSVSRNINDMLRLTPQAQSGVNGPAIGGGSYRQNFITVDGAAFNNAFGIDGNLPGKGSPISIDALDQISVSLTPYDVRQTGFIGAAINAVTKSGTNEFKGSAYTYQTDDRMRGNKVEDEYFTNPPSQYKLYGITLGGPIIKDKLFFFVNFETENTIAPGPLREASTDGKASGQTIARPTAAEMDMMSTYLRDKYGYETGPYQGYSFESPGKKFLARIDWNINPNHKVNIRYSYMTSKEPYSPSTSTSPVSNPYTGNRQSMSAMWYQNSGYFQERNFSSLSGELNSRFMDGNLNNTLRATWSYQDEPRSVDGKEFPAVDILKDGEVLTSFGTEVFTYGNLRQVNTYNITDEIMYKLGFNNITLGLSYESNHTKNGFMRFGTGWYIFDSWDTFVNGGNPTHYSITFSNTPGYKQAFPSFKFNQFSFYLQDEAKINDRFNLTGGIRFDLPIYPEYHEALQEHPMISKLDFNGTKYNTANLPKTRVMISPRIGFNYDLTGDRKIVVRGGTGIFTGRIPFVWICSQSGDAGMLQTTMLYSGADVPGPFKTDRYLPAEQPAAGTIIPTGGFTIMDPDFKMPSTWKSSLAVDFKLPFDFNATIEGVYNKDINSVMIYKDGLVEPEAMNIAGYADHRLIYPAGGAKYTHRLNAGGLPDDNGNNGATPMLIKNITKGNGYYASISFKLEKQMWEGLSGMVAYTYSWAKSLHDGWGDQLYSVWNGYGNVNGSNAPELGYGSYVVPNMLIGSLSYKYHGFTTSIFYTGTNDGRASYYYTSNIAQDGGGATNLIYVPKDPSEIKFVDRKDNSGNVIHTAKEQSDAFFKYIEQDDYLKTRKGKYAEKNALLYPWAHQFDVKFTQDFTVKAGNTNHTLQLGMDITNVGNLLNPKWGNRWTTFQTQLLQMTNANQVTANGTVVPEFMLNTVPGTTDLPTETFRKSVAAASTYRMMLSLRYYFN